MAVTALRANGTKATYANLVNGNVGSAGYVGLAVAGGDSDAWMRLLGNTGTTTPTASFQLSLEGGTSFAAPQVSGLIALMFAIDPSLTADQAVNLVKNNVATFPNPGGLPACAVDTANCVCDQNTCGAGIVDAGAAVAAALAGVSGRADTDTSADFIAPVLYASFFTPDRVLYAERERRGSGGGGASDVGMLALLAALATWMLGAAAWPRLQVRRAAHVSAQGITTGTR